MANWTMDWINTSDSLPPAETDPPVKYSIWTLAIVNRQNFCWQLLRYNFRDSCWESRDGLLIAPEYVESYAILDIPPKPIRQSES